MKKTKEQSANEWLVFSGESDFSIILPKRYAREGFGPDWTAIENEIIDDLGNSFEIAHHYFWIDEPFYIGTVPDFQKAAAPGELMLIDKPHPRKGYPFNDPAIALPDCQNRKLWQLFFGTQTFDYDKILICFKEKINDWAELFIGLRENLGSTHHVVIPELWKPMVNYVVFCVDSDLFLTVIDLPNDEVISVLEGIAQKHDLTLDIQSK